MGGNPMGFADEELAKYTRQGRSGKKPQVVVVERGGMFYAFLEGRGHVVGMGSTAKEAVNSLRGLL